MESFRNEGDSHHPPALHGLRPAVNFEELYATISSERKYADLAEAIESR